MAGMVAPIADERVGLLAYLEQQRYVIKLTAYGLTDEEARLTPAASPLSVGGLIKHVASVEEAWMDTVLQRDRGSGDDYETNFRLLPDETLADVVARYDEVARGTAAVIDAIPDLAPGRAGAAGSSVVPGRRRRVVGAVGAVAPDRGDRASRRSRRHGARSDRRRHRVPAHGCSGRLADDTVDAAVGEGDERVRSGRNC